MKKFAKMVMAIVVATLFCSVFAYAEAGIVERSKKENAIVFTGGSRFIEYSIEGFIKDSRKYVIRFTLDREPESTFAFFGNDLSNSGEFPVKQTEYDLKNNRYSYEVVVDASRLPMPSQYLLSFGSCGAVSGYPNGHSIEVDGNTVTLLDENRTVIGDLSAGFHYTVKLNPDRKADTYGIEEVLVLGYDKQSPNLFKVAVVASSSKELDYSHFGEGIALKRKGDVYNYKLELGKDFYVYDFDEKKGNYVWLLVFDTSRVSNSFSLAIDPKIEFFINGNTLTQPPDCDKNCIVKDLLEDASYHVR